MTPRALSFVAVALLAVGASGCATVNPVCLFNCTNGLERKMAVVPQEPRGGQSIAVDPQYRGVAIYKDNVDWSGGCACGGVTNAMVGAKTHCLPCQTITLEGRLDGLAAPGFSHGVQP